jgi:predicted phosphoribosyltransferase
MEKVTVRTAGVTAVAVIVTVRKSVCHCAVVAVPANVKTPVLELHEPVTPPGNAPAL